LTSIHTPASTIPLSSEHSHNCSALFFNTQLILLLDHG
jgi:hypothetical protein